MDKIKWKTLQITNRETPFSLSGGGTKKIPVSRPQIVVNDHNDPVTIYLIYQDIERESKVSINVSMDIDTNRWLVYDITDFSVNSWEPSYDTELWKDSAILNIFVQKVGQGDGETLEDLPAQPVYVLGMPDSLLPSDTITVIPFNAIERNKNLPYNNIDIKKSQIYKMEKNVKSRPNI